MNNQAIEQREAPADRAAEGTPPVLWKLCKNCFGTGTLFVGKGRLGVSRVCPVCKGKTKVPA